MEGDQPSNTNGRTAQRDGPSLQRIASRDRVSKYQDSIDRLKALEAKDAAAQQRASANRGTSENLARSQSLGATRKAETSNTGLAKPAKLFPPKKVKKTLQTKKIVVLSKKATAGKPKVGRIGRVSKKVVGKVAKTGLKVKAAAPAKKQESRSESASRDSARSASAHSNEENNSNTAKKTASRKKAPGVILKQSKTAVVQKVVRNRGRDPRDEIPKVEKFHRKPRVHAEPTESVKAEPVVRKPRPVKAAEPARPAEPAQADGLTLDALIFAAGESAAPQTATAPEVTHATAAEDGIDISMMIEAQESSAKREQPSGSGDKRAHHRSNERSVPTAGLFSNLMMGDAEEHNEEEAAPAQAVHKTPEKVAAEHHHTPQKSATKMAEEPIPSARKDHHESTPQKPHQAETSAPAEHHQASAHHTPSHHAPAEKSHQGSAAKPAAAPAQPNGSESSMTSQNNSSNHVEEQPDQPNQPAADHLELDALVGAQELAQAAPAHPAPEVAADPVAPGEHPAPAQQENTVENVTFF